MTIFSNVHGRMRAALAVARIVMGLIFLSVWFYNLRTGLYSTSGYADLVQGYARDTSTPFVPTILESVVIPAAAFFSKAQLVAELVFIAIPLTIGLFTPVAGLIGLLFAIPLGLAANGTPGEWGGTYIMIVLLLAMITITQAGRTWGLDVLLARRDPHPRLPVY